MAGALGGRPGTRDELGGVPEASLQHINLRLDLSQPGRNQPWGWSDHTHVYIYYSGYFGHSKERYNEGHQRVIIKNEYKYS